MEISGSLFARGHQIYERVSGFRTEVACLANYLDQVPQIVNLILRVIKDYQRRTEFLNAYT